MKTRDLHDNDLDSIWTPGAFSGRFGLHVDSAYDAPPQPSSGPELAPTRAVDPPFRCRLPNVETTCRPYIRKGTMATAERGGAIAGQNSAGACDPIELPAELS